jgi:hypothetical protein
LSGDNAGEERTDFVGEGITEETNDMARDLSMATREGVIEEGLFCVGRGVGGEGLWRERENRANYKEGKL